MVSVEQFSNYFKGKYSHMVRFRHNWRRFLYFGDGPGYQDCGKYFQRDKIHNSIELKYQANEGLQCIDPNLFRHLLQGGSAIHVDNAETWEDWDGPSSRKVANTLRSQHRICPFSAQAAMRLGLLVHGQ